MDTPVSLQVLGANRTIKLIQASPGKVIEGDLSSMLVNRVWNYNRETDYFEGHASETSIRRHRELELQIRKDMLAHVKRKKILLLGNADSGKTTIFKQMRILHMNGFGEIDLFNYRYLVYTNATQSLKQIMDAAKEFGINWDSEISNDMQNFLNFLRDGVSEGYMELSLDVANSMQRIWKSQKIQEVFDRRWEFELMDSAKYFLDSLNRIGQRHYVPSLQDVLHCRHPTVTISEIEFHYRELSLCMIDVGGQRAQQRKWIHLFDGVDAVLFICALSEYDRTLSEDPEMNRMRNSLLVFKNTVRSQYFKRTAVILFLNKRDVFEEKLLATPLTVCFPKFEGPNTFEEASKYIQERFARRMPLEKGMYCHTTIATDTNNVNIVFEACMDHILQKNVREAGFA